jgi:hypothetical protein
MTTTSSSTLSPALCSRDNLTSTIVRSACRMSRYGITPPPGMFMPVMTRNRLAAPSPG